MDSGVKKAYLFKGLPPSGFQYSKNLFTLVRNVYYNTNIGGIPTLLNGYVANCNFVDPTSVITRYLTINPSNCHISGYVYGLNSPASGSTMKVCKLCFFKQLFEFFYLCAIIVCYYYR
jgi:hypothetical protein